MVQISFYWADQYEYVRIDYKKSIDFLVFNYVQQHIFSIDLGIWKIFWHWKNLCQKRMWTNGLEMYHPVWSFQKYSTRVLIVRKYLIVIFDKPPLLEGILHRIYVLLNTYTLIRATTHRWHYKYVFDRESIVQLVLNFGTQTFPRKSFTSGASS